MSLSKISLLLALASVSTSARAAEPSTADEIVVTGRSEDPTALRHGVTRFIGQVAEAADQNQLARRRGGYCPRISGLPDRDVPAVLARFADAAAAARLTAKPPGCRPDMVVIFTGNGDALMRAARSRKPGLFTELEPTKTRELFGSGRAIRWWYETAALNGNGVAIPKDPRRYNPAGEPDRNPIYSASLIRTEIKIDLATTVTVIDVNKARGFPLEALASYAAMVSFAQLSAKDATLGQAPSVLGMFAQGDGPGAAPLDLTRWDRAYLAGLYRIPLDRPIATQRRMLSTAMQTTIAAE
jgi:hypothetical protein